MLMVTLNFELTKEDYFQFYYYSLWLAPGKKVATIKSRVKYFLFFAVAFFVVKFSASPHNLDFFFFYVVFIFASIYIFPLFSVESNSRKQAEAFCNNHLNANYFLPSEIIFSETGIFGKFSYEEVSYKWSSIVKKVELKGHFLLYQGDNQAIIIPKAAIKSESDFKKLLELFGKHIPFNAEVGHLVKD